MCAGLTRLQHSSRHLRVLWHPLHLCLPHQHHLPKHRCPRARLALWLGPSSRRRARTIPRRRRSRRTHRSNSCRRTCTSLRLLPLHLHSPLPRRLWRRHHRLPRPLRPARQRRRVAGDSTPAPAPLSTLVRQRRRDGLSARSIRVLPLPRSQRQLLPQLAALAWRPARLRSPSHPRRATARLVTQPTVLASRTGPTRRLQRLRPSMTLAMASRPHRRLQSRRCSRRRRSTPWRVQRLRCNRHLRMAPPPHRLHRRLHHMPMRPRRRRCTPQRPHRRFPPPPPTRTPRRHRRNTRRRRCSRSLSCSNSLIYSRSLTCSRSLICNRSPLRRRRLRRCCPETLGHSATARIRAAGSKRPSTEMAPRGHRTRSASNGSITKMG